MKTREREVAEDIIGGALMMEASAADFSALADRIAVALMTKEAEVVRLTAEAAANAHMLAQQCDLAREAEAKALQAAERMRERCVVEADRQGDHCEMTSNRQGQAAAERIAANIRALSLEEP